MAKGIIMVDIPQDCYGCSFATGYGECMITGETVDHSPPCRPDGCSIQPVPERITDRAVSLYEYGYKNGYNRCIDDILGGYDESTTHPWKDNM